MEEDIRKFLGQKRIAVAGVSRKGGVPANAIYKKLRTAGYQVFAVNPNASELEGDVSYPDIAAIPGGVNGLVIAAHPSHAAGLVQQCIDSRVQLIWFHRSVGQGSYDEDAAELAKKSGIAVIPGGCPMMYCHPVDLFHRCFRWMCGYPAENFCK